MRKILYILFVLVVGQCYGQISSESTYFNTIYKLYKAQPSLLPVASLSSFTHTNLYYTQQKGSLHLGQGASTNQNFGLNTHGLFAYKKSWLLGGITIERNYQEGKQWNLSPYEVSQAGVMPNPHYFAVSKGSAWNNQHYYINATAVVPLTYYWHLSIGTNYNLKEQYRYSFDPRLKILTYYLKLKAHTALNLLPNVKLWGGVSFNKESNGTRITRSDANEDTPVHNHKYLRSQYGYGMLFFREGESTQAQHSRYNIQSGIRMTNKKGAYLLGVDIHQHYTDNYNNNKEEKLTSDITATFSHSSIKGWGTYHTSISSNIQLLSQLSYKKGKAYNFIQMQQGRTYQYKYRVLHANVLLYQTHNKLYQEAGISLMQAYHQQTDALALTQTTHIPNELSIWAKKEFSIGKWVIAPQLTAQLWIMQHSLNNNNPYYYAPITSKDYSQSAIKLFYDEVIYHDHSLLNNNRLGGSINLCFKRPLGTTTTYVINIDNSFVTSGKYNQHTLNLSLTFIY